MQAVPGTRAPVHGRTWTGNARNLARFLRSWVAVLLCVQPPARCNPMPDEHVDGSYLLPWIPQMRVSRLRPGPIPELASEYRVVVTMTTVPRRIPRLEPVLNSMLAQTWPVEAIYLNIPYRYNRTGELYRVPQWLRAKPGIRIRRCEDMGPGTHLLNGLRLEPDPWTFLVVVDDDHVYAPDLVEHLMRAALAHPGTAVASQGFLSIPRLALDKESPRYLHDDGFAAGPVLVSYLGVVYQRGFFDDEVFNHKDVSPQCRYQDDMWFSAHLARKGIRRAVLGAAMGVQELTDLHLGPSSLTFWKENKPKQVSMDCNAALLEHFPEIWSFRRRVVLIVAGLPPLPPRPSIDFVSEEPLADGWEDAFAVLDALQQTPDLTYLCSSQTSETTEPIVAGASFRLRNGLLTSVSDTCIAREKELRLGKALRAPLRWEGDPDTIVVIASLHALRQASKSALRNVAGCAASVAVSDEAGARPHGETFTSSRKAAATSICQAARLEGSESVIVQTSPESPFCREEDLVAVSIGALGSLAPRGLG